ncbi:MAG TPA: GntR family transcriptional regulator [Candidatus Gemmiger avistercoris]|uniref:GntR family transcriptional regulator n=1 Tax=Candidatus Gemmiger avistercoris TaxID=2838606 RepID=A0A9D2FII7_9FIRM|nr:GntR family transcriptional regulator [uncultured Subdoligranulum sp.]HIZ61709.1 GntR family transcriptional regulator [Candidatus Gemmiger avistercoris]
MPPVLNDHTSIYLQIAKMLEDGILRGIYPEETQVPSTNELARTLCINPATGAKGLNLLVEEGILYKRRGLGMFVSEGAADRIRAKRREEFFTQYVKPLAAEARKLGLTAEELQAMLQAACRQEE